MQGRWEKRADCHLRGWAEAHITSYHLQVSLCLSCRKGPAEDAGVPPSQENKPQVPKEGTWQECKHCGPGCPMPPRDPGTHDDACQLCPALALKHRKKMTSAVLLLPTSHADLELCGEGHSGKRNPSVLNCQTAGPPPVPRGVRTGGVPGRLLRQNGGEGNPRQKHSVLRGVNAAPWGWARGSLWSPGPAQSEQLRSWPVVGFVLCVNRTPVSARRPDWFSAGGRPTSAGREIGEV